MANPNHHPPASPASPASPAGKDWGGGGGGNVVMPVVETTKDATQQAASGGLGVPGSLGLAEGNPKDTDQPKAK